MYRSSIQCKIWQTNIVSQCEFLPAAIWRWDLCPSRHCFSSQTKLSWCKYYLVSGEEKAIWEKNMAGSHRCVITTDWKLVYTEKKKLWSWKQTTSINRFSLFFLFWSTGWPRSTQMQVHCSCAGNFQQSNLSQRSLELTGSSMQFQDQMCHPVSGLWWIIEEAPVFLD